MLALRNLLKPSRLTQIMDVGEKDDLPCYQSMLEMGVCATVRRDDVAKADYIRADAATTPTTRLIAPARTSAVAIEYLVYFTPTGSQPPFGQTDLDLRDLGFVPHCFVEAKVVPIFTEISVPQDPHQLSQASILYVRNYGGFADSDAMEPEQWKHLAMIAHHICGSYDLAMRAILNLTKSGVLASDAPSQYQEIIRDI